MEILSSLYSRRFVELRYNKESFLRDMSVDEDAHDEEATAVCGTTKGSITIKFYRKWSPHGYDKAVTLMERGFYDHSHFFRVVPKFLVQFGISYSKDKELQALARQQIPDDPQLADLRHFQPGYVSFAGSGPHSRTSQLFISYGSAPSLGKDLWETPIGQVVEGMEHATQFYSYGDMPPWGKGPLQGKIHGNPSYIETNFPLTDKFLTCRVERSSNQEESLSSSPEDVEMEVPRKQRLGQTIGKAILQRKTAYEEDGNQMLLIAGIAIGMILYVSMRNRKKVASKKS